jgi:cytochrome d ubiquinol oxidase subunit I
MWADGVATGVTMDFCLVRIGFIYSQYVGVVVGAPLPLEGLLPFSLKRHLLLVLFLARNKLSQWSDLLVTWMVALGASFSALWIVNANAWMTDSGW